MVSKIVQITTALIILLIGGGVAWLLISTKKEAEKIDVSKKPTLVEVQIVKSEPQVILISTQGEIIAPKKTTLSAQVTGQVVSTSPKFEVGGVIQEGEVIVMIEEIDYQTALIEAKAAYADAIANVKEAEVNLTMEQARVGQAKRDWQKLGRGKEPSDLLLRKPQIEAAKARIESSRVSAECAQGRIELAQRNLERTRIRAPYNCQVEQKQIELGALVSMGSAIGRFYGTGRVEARVPISLEDIPYLPELSEGRAIPVIATGKFGSQVKKWNGEIIRSENRIDSASRTAFLIASFEGEEIPPVGMFAQIEIEGLPLDDVISIPRIALRGRDQVIVISEESKIEFRTVEVIRTTQDSVYVSKGLADGDRVCLTVMSSPIVGTEVITSPEKE